MNRKNNLLMIASIMLLGVLFSSCSLIKDSNFNIRKYTHYKNHDTTCKAKISLFFYEVPTIYFSIL